MRACLAVSRVCLVMNYLQMTECTDCHGMGHVMSAMADANSGGIDMEKCSGCKGKGRVVYRKPEPEAVAQTGALGRLIGRFFRRAA
ncbi:MAG: DnaJ-class molecular chaperone [Chlamydiales bacterium]|jgi:DnaJ-class molecular chaperone